MNNMNNVNHERIVKNFLELVRIDNPSLNERAMADEIKSRLADLGVSVEEDASASGTGSNAGNLFARLDGDNSLLPLLFSAHLDSVAPAEGKQAVKRDDRIMSAGNTVLGADDLAGIAEIFEALYIIKERGLNHRSIELLFTTAEELYDLGSRNFDFSRIQSREAYVLDATGQPGTFIYKAPTIISFEASIIGRSSHAGFSPEAGVHAIKIASGAVSNIQTGRITPDTTLNIGTIAGGIGTNIVPPLCVVTGEVRSHDHARALALTKESERIFRDEAEKYGGKAGFMSEICCTAYETAADSDVVSRFRSACNALSLPFLPVVSFGGSDASSFMRHGISTVVASCGMERVHTTEEYIEEESLVSCAELVLSLMTI